jgi:hypothetical protein
MAFCHFFCHDIERKGPADSQTSGFALAGAELFGRPDKQSKSQLVDRTREPQLDKLVAQSVFPVFET